MDMSAYAGSLYWKGTDLEPGVLYRMTITAVALEEFKDGTRKPVLSTDHPSGKKVVCTPTKTKALIKAFGPNSNNYIGKLIVLRQGTTLFQGEKVPCVDMEPVVTTKVAAPPERKVINAPPPPAPSEIEPPSREGDDLGDPDPDEEIPF
jgi:hypothetical protein